MQIVIDIPDRLIKKVKDHYVNPYEVDEICGAILDGTPLPKGHGDIVDIETLIDMFWDGNSMEITKYDLSVIEPIIEADKESEEISDTNLKMWQEIFKAESEDKE